VKLREIGEFGFIDRIAAGAVPADPSRVLQGIGDDASVVRPSAGLLLVTTDLMVERVHFLRDSITMYQLGRKSVAISLSDIAAMGGVPHDLYVSIAVPEDLQVEELDELYRGMKEIAREAGVDLLGGDTTGSRQDLVINTTVTGSAAPDEVIYRHGARPGDRILVTGTLGDSAGGLRIVLESLRLPDEIAAPLLKAHCDPELYLREARLLAVSGRVHSGIDLSDGLASDLGHICRASNVGAVLESGRVPVSAELKRLCEIAGGDPLELALSGGEDYRLLVTVDPDAADALADEIRRATGRTPHAIGRIVEGEDIFLETPDGRLDPLRLRGYDHFKR